MSEKKSYNGSRIFANILWALLGMATVGLLGAAMSLRNNMRCKGVNINISGTQNNFFIDKNEIREILEKLCGGSIAGKTLGTFNLAMFENTLRKNRWILNAELFFDNNELLQVRVTEREPVARIFTTMGSSFYLDSSLTRLPLSDKAGARVPVFSNFPAPGYALTKADSSLLKEVKNISSYILKDPFWMAQIEQVDITPDRTFEMVPKVGNQIIVFGNAENYEEKFNNLLTFYRQVATRVGWNTYSKINVQYKGQVVAVKRGTEDIIQDLLRTKQIMESIVANAQKHSGDSIKNIQLDQQQDDNIIPVAPQLDDIPFEQPTTEPKPANTTADTPVVNTRPSSHEKPGPILAKKIPEKGIVAEKKVTKTVTKPFWLRSAITSPATASKKNPVKSKSLSNGRPNPNLSKKPVVVKSSTKPVKKATIKPVIKQKPKAVMPANDY